MKKTKTVTAADRAHADLNRKANARMGRALIRDSVRSAVLLLEKLPPLERERALGKSPPLLETLDRIDAAIGAKALAEHRAEAGIPLNVLQHAPKNPKDAIGSGKLPLHLVPASLDANVALAFFEGALKYGKFNWRASGVNASIYADAAKRHIDKWLNGEDDDPKTRVPHLANAAACLAILIDAKLVGKLHDDRPPPAPLGEWIDATPSVLAHLRDLFAGHTPKHWTIADAAIISGNPLDMPLSDRAKKDLRAGLDSAKRGEIKPFDELKPRRKPKKP